MGKERKKKIYSKHKEPYVKLRKDKEYHTNIDIIATVMGEDDNPWLIFASQLKRGKIKSKPVKDINKMMVADYLPFIPLNEKETFIKYIMNLDINPLESYIPINKLGPQWSKYLTDVEKYLERRSNTLKQIKSKQHLIVMSAFGYYYEVEDLRLNNFPFEIKGSIDFYIVYDKTTKTWMIKTNPYHPKRMKLSKLYNILNEILPDKLYIHGAEYFIKSNKEIKENENKKILNELRDNIDIQSIKNPYK